MRDQLKILDRRKSVRTLWINADTAKQRDNKDPDHENQYFLENISETGLSLITDKPMEKGKVQYLNLPILGNVKIQCIWVSPTSESNKFISGWRILTTSLTTALNNPDLVNNHLKSLPDRRIKERRTSNITKFLDQRSSTRRREDIFLNFNILSSTGGVQFRREHQRRIKNRRENQISSQQLREDKRGASRRKNERRVHGPVHDLKESTLGRSIRKTIATLRDAAIKLYPKSVNKMLYGEGSFAFVTHPRDTDDIQRMFPVSKYLPEKLINYWLKHQWPVVGTRIEKIQALDGKVSNGWLIFCPLTAKQMIRDRESAKKKVIDTVKVAEKLGARIVGLGAFTSIVTSDGQDISNHVDIGITTGNALSAAVAVQNIARATDLKGLELKNLTVAIVGAGGNVGAACSRAFYGNVKKLILIDINPRTLKACSDELIGKGTEIICNNNTDNLPDADVVIAVTNSPGAIVRSKDLKHGAIVIDAAQPKNVSETVPSERPDVMVIESSIVELPSIECRFDLGIGPREALGCMAETIVLDGIGWHKHFSIGKLQPEQSRSIMAMAKILGIKVGYFRNSKGYVSEIKFRKYDSVQ